MRWTALTAFFFLFSAHGMTFVPLSLEGGAKSEKLAQTVELFKSQYPDFPLQAVKAASEQELFAAMASREGRWFTPPDSAQTIRFAAYLKAKNLKKPDWMHAQVLASEQAHGAFDLVSTFMPAARYTDGLAAELAAKEGVKTPVRIFTEDSMIYFPETARAAERSLRNAGFADIKTRTYADSRLKAEFAAAAVPSSAILIFISIRSPDRLAGLPGFDGATRVRLYAAGDGRALFPSSKREIHILFWSAEIDYPGHGKRSNCDFVAQFRERFKSEPDFHAAYLYAALETALQSSKGDPRRTKNLKTILGPVTYDAAGFRVESRPLFAVMEKGGRRLAGPAADSLCKGGKK